MSTILYWAARLRDGFPIYDPNFRKPDITFKAYKKQPDRIWPRAVCRSDMYNDYKSWCEKEMRKLYEQTPLFRESPNLIPAPDEELMFRLTLSPWLYLISKKKQVKSYYVDQQQFWEGEWLDVKVRRYFIRLCPIEQHIEAFESATGFRLTERITINNVTLEVIPERQEEVLTAIH